VVDGSGLENRRTRKGTGGSNPSLSATQSEPAEISSSSLEIRERKQTGLQRTDHLAVGCVNIPLGLTNYHG
jgi:hypothetical protein